jgi:hypothetical protein
VQGVGTITTKTLLAGKGAHRLAGALARMLHWLISTLAHELIVELWLAGCAPSGFVRL